MVCGLLILFGLFGGDWGACKDSRLGVPISCPCMDCRQVRLWSLGLAGVYLHALLVIGVSLAFMHIVTLLTSLRVQVPKYGIYSTP